MAPFFLYHLNPTSNSICWKYMGVGGLFLGEKFEKKFWAKAIYWKVADTEAQKKVY